MHSKNLTPTARRTCAHDNLIKLIPKTTDKEPKILALDTEDNSKGSTIMTNIFDGENHFTFRHTEAAIEWLLNESKKYKKGLEIWTANVQYDTGNVFRESQEFLNVTLAGSRFIKVKINKEKLVLKDILNVIPGASVKKLGALIDLPKLDSGNDFDNEEYCQRDTEIVYFALLFFKNKLAKLNVSLKNTAAGTAFNALLKKFPLMQSSMLTEDDHEFMKQGYYGGRTEVFNTAKQTGNIFGYDIVSSYPAAMCEIPIVDTRSKTYPKKPDFNNEGFIDCVVDCPDIAIPYLPLKHDDKLIFPRGTFTGVWTYFELNRAKKLGYKIIKINRCIEFKAKYDFNLKPFIDKFFKVKSQSKIEKDFVMEYAAKILLNSSYGKLAMGNEKVELVAFDHFHSIKGDFSSEVFPNNQIIVKKKSNHQPSTNFLTAALITAYGRDKLYDALISSHENGVLLYCDTDSVFVKDYELPTPKKSNLGDWELKDEITEAQFILPKTYYLKFKDMTEIYKCKGVWGDLAKKYFTEGHVTKKQPLKYIETCRKNLQIKNRNKKYKQNAAFIPFNLWVDKPKGLKADYNKRIMLKNGATSPIKLNFNVETKEYI